MPWARSSNSIRELDKIVGQNSQRPQCCGKQQDQSESVLVTLKECVPKARLQLIGDRLPEIKGNEAGNEDIAAHREIP